ncbi:putative linocin/CFP29 family protein [Natranaerovirga pectinivora]|uniref:Type 1 encapsulin shell protein n=1 Tax=Natranaerovirga pectinivora TaxID=682400 RepID=A0A4R3MNT6_9FIRM|nr:family 1 encapsulin nanocompartment shell protein [Natranaerovirga pectinivora]TCT15704.1 putative linocin/CFP29 family protein [Natranaerovirga pectinivora]
MDMLKRSLAPLAEEAWKEIENRAAQVLKTHLSARKVVKVEGPKGWDFSAISEGRLELIKEGNGEVTSGLYSVQPLVETRISFELDRWEMDNIIRGAKDIDLEPLEKAAEKIAAFEENAIYNGYEKAKIKGLSEIAAHNLPFGKDAASIMDSISKGILKLKHAYSEGPYTLIVGDEGWKYVNTIVNGYPLKKTIESLLGTEIIYTKNIGNAILIPYNHDDLEFTIGQDFSIGYEGHDTKKVKLFITESFTFRILDSSIIINYTI